MEKIFSSGGAYNFELYAPVQLTRKKMKET